MKRPEGFDRGPEPPRPTPSPRVKQPRRPAPHPEKAPHPDKAPSRVRTPRAAHEPAQARAELATAERLRKREERAERRRFTRASRRRRVAILTATGLVVVMVSLVAVAVFSPLLALRDIRVDGVQKLTAAEVQTAVDGQLGTPLALIDDGRLRSDLSKFRLVRSYSTELVPPHTLIIHIVERSAIGVVAGDKGFDTVDAAGVVISSSPQRPEGFPLINLGSGTVDGVGFTAMAQVLLALPPSVRSQVDTLSAHSRDDVTLVLTGSGQRVLWGGPEDAACKANTLALLVNIYATHGSGSYDVSSCGHAVWRAD